MSLNRGGQEPPNLATAVNLTVGRASVCWSDMSKTGVFDDQRAREAADDLIAYVEKYYIPNEDALNYLAASQDPNQPTLPGI